MNHSLHRDNILTAAGGAVTGGLVGGSLGSLLGGPVGFALGVVAGTAFGAEAGEHISDAIDLHGDLGYFASTYTQMPYYVSEMEWEDYEPAYRYAMEQYSPDADKSIYDRDGALERGWREASQRSHLTWPQVRPVVDHVWDTYAQRETQTRNS